MNDSTTCYICGEGVHARIDVHDFWSIADARREFSSQPEGPMPSMSAAETLDPREAVFA
jgi:hypothetical protein